MWTALFTRNGVKKVRRSEGGEKRQNGKKANVREMGRVGGKTENGMRENNRKKAEKGAKK